MRKTFCILALLWASTLVAQESFLQLPPDSTGKRMRMRTSTQSSILVYSQAFFLDDGNGGPPLGVVSNPIFTTFTNAAIAATQSGAWTVGVNNFPATQAISASSLPLPSGASTEATLALIKAKTDNLDVLLSTRTKPADQQHVIVDTTPTTAVTGPVTDTQLRATPVPISGTVTANVGTGTQPVSGTVTANVGTTNGLALDATLTGGTEKAIARGGAKGATTAADVTSTANGADHQGLDVQLQNASVAVTGTFWQATQPVSGTVTTTPPANASTNIAQMNGTTVSMNTGTRDAGTQRVTIATNDSVPVTGTFFQGTQPVSAASLPLPSGASTEATVAKLPIAQGAALGTNAGPLIQGSVTTAAPTYTTGNINPLSLTTAGAVRTDSSGTTQPVSGTVTANAGTNLNTSALALDATLTGGTQRTKVTDGTNNAAVKAASTAAATTDPALVVAVSPNNNVRVVLENTSGTNSAAVRGASSAAAASDPAIVVTLSPNSPLLGITNALPAGTAIIGKFTTDQTTHGTTDLVASDQVKIAGTAIVTGGLAGSQSVGGTQANNTAITANPLLMGAESITMGTNPTVSTTGNIRRAVSNTEGTLFVQLGGANQFSCFVQAVTATTQCQAAPAAGLRAYVTGIHFSNQAATVQTLDVVYGTGTNCGTGTTALTHKWQMGTNATTTSPQSIDAVFNNPLVPVAANAICVRPSAATAFGATLTGFIAP